MADSRSCHVTALELHAVDTGDFIVSPVVREYFAVDLRGLRTALAARRDFTLASNAFGHCKAALVEPRINS